MKTDEIYNQLPEQQVAKNPACATGVTQVWNTICACTGLHVMTSSLHGASLVPRPSASRARIAYS